MRVHTLIFAVACVCIVSSTIVYGITPEPGYVRTRFGWFHASCVVRVPSGTTVSEVNVEDNSALAGVNGKALGIEFPNGTYVVQQGCQFRPKLNARTARGIASRKPNVQPWFDVVEPQPSTVYQWNGMYEHSWFGMERAPWSDPLPSNIVNISAAWRVPPMPASNSPAAGAPWQNAPTLSQWPGVQGGAVLQPVMELNGLLPGSYDAVSWNCCPSGAVVHSEPYAAGPGDVISGHVARSGDTKTFEIVTTVGSHSSVLKADMSNVNGWTGDWAEFVTESYYVSQCSEFMQPVAFSDVHLSLESGTRWSGCAGGYKQVFEAASVSNPTPPCSGIGKCGGGTITLYYDV